MKEELKKSIRLQNRTFVLVITLIVVMLFLVLFLNNNHQTDIWLRFGAFLALLIAIVVLFYIHTSRQTLELNLRIDNFENERRKDSEEKQAEKQHAYRLESLKWEKTLEIAKLLAETKDPDENKKEISKKENFAKELVDLVKIIMVELNK